MDLSVSMLGDLFRVGYEDQRRAMMTEVLEARHDRFSGARVKVACGLICHDDGRPGRERPSDRYALTLSAGQLAWLRIGKVWDSHVSERRKGSRPHPGGVYTAIVHRQFHVLDD
ncbi:hypothetical protein BEP68_09210 [Microbacterium sp. 4-7]|nr:hypothetical protein [Microbacterium sp. 4-7]